MYKGWEHSNDDGIVGERLEQNRAKLRVIKAGDKSELPSIIGWAGWGQPIGKADPF